MLDPTPFKLKGKFYPDHQTEGCPNYHTCRRCYRCNHYDKHNATCIDCESIKTDSLHCTCSDLSQWAVVQIEDKLGRPMYDINSLGGKVMHEKPAVMETAFDGHNAMIAKAMAEG